MSTTVAEHKMRLENGTKAFDGLREKQADLDAIVRPPAPSIIKIVAFTLSIFLAAAGALWGLAQMLRDRPTVEQVDRIIDQRGVAHEGAGHSDIRESIRSIQLEQGAQSEVLDTAVRLQAADSKKLDALLDRVPVKRRR